VSSDQVETPEVSEAPTAPKAGRGLSARWFTIIGVVIVFNIAAFILFPPFPKGGQPGDACAYPACFIEGTLEFPAPHTVLGPVAPADALVTFTPSISSTILTQWLVIIVILVVAIPMARGGQMLPGRFQNIFETF
jgi:hypothetical protein